MPAMPASSCASESATTEQRTWLKRRRTDSFGSRLLATDGVARSVLAVPFPLIFPLSFMFSIVRTVCWEKVEASRSYMSLHHQYGEVLCQCRSNICLKMPRRTRSGSVWGRSLMPTSRTPYCVSNKFHSTVELA